MQKVIKQCRNKLLILHKCIFALFLALFFILPSFSALAYNDDYLDSEKWVVNDNVVYQKFNIDSPFSTAFGSFMYSSDSNEYSFYVNVSVTEDSITDDAQAVSLEFTITNEYERYSFSMNSDGELDYLGKENKLFNVASNFNTYPQTNSGDYIAAIDINNGYSSNSISLSININGHRYSLFRDVIVERPVPPEKQTTKKEKTTKKATTKPAKVTSGKTTAAKGDKTSQPKTTKYSGNVIYSKAHNSKLPDFSAESQPEADVNGEAELADDSVIAVEEDGYKNGSSHLTTQSLILLIIGIIIATAGVMLLIFSRFKRKESSSDSSKERAEDEEEIIDDNFDF